MVTVTVNDKGLKRLTDALEEIGRAKVLVGWQGEKGNQIHPDSDLTNAEVATMMEFGTSKMPARPAIAIAEERNRGELIALVQSMMGDLAEGKIKPSDVLVAIGESGLNALRVAIEDAAQWAVPLAESTIKAKGLDVPWIDTGTLYDTAEVTIERGVTILPAGQSQLPGAIGGST